MQNKTWRFHAIGGPDVLQLDSLDMPEPAPHEVRIKVKAVGLNRSDLLWITAAFFQPVLPAKVGYEICGIVDKVGSAVTGFKPGDRISNLPTQYIGSYATFAEYAVLPGSAIVHTPEALSDAEGAAFLFTNLTQMCGLSELALLKPGQTLLITAGSSANGLSAILIGRRLGAHVIATTRGAAKRDLLLETGAHEVIVTDDELLSERVLALTGGRGADVVYDCVGGALSEELVKSTAPNGRWIMYGFLDPSTVSTHWALWFTRQLTLNIYSLMQFTGLEELGLLGRPVEFRRALDSVLALCGKRELAIPIARTYHGIEAVPDAFRAMEANVGGGKMVVLF